MRFVEVDRYLVPEGDRAAVRYYLRRHYVAHGLRERLHWRLLRASGGGLGSRLPVIRRWLLDLEDLSLRARDGDGGAWADVGPALRAVGRDDLARAVLLRDYRGSERGQLVCFPFRGERAAPRAVIKVRRLGPSGSEGRPLRAESRTLRDVAERLPAGLRATIPRVLSWREEGGWERLSLSHLPGRPAYQEMQNHLVPARRVEAHFRAAGSWLTRFHRETRHPDTDYRPAPADRARVREVDGGGLVRAAPEWYGELLELLDRRPLRLSGSHGDFWPRNMPLTVEGQGCDSAPPAGVVDWEHYEPAAPPFEDLFDFAVSYGANYPWSRDRRLPLPQAFRRTFVDDTLVSGAVRRYVRDYARHAGLSPRMMDRLFRLYVVRRAKGARGGQRRRWDACWRSLPTGNELLFGS